MTNTKYNQFLMENVFNHGTFDSIECPECGAPANYKDYDRNDGGCINSYYSTTCTVCDYHNCNDDFCSICASEGLSEKQMQYIFCDVEMDFFFEESDPMRCLSPTKLTELKLQYLAVNCSVEGYPNLTLFERIKIGVRTFLDRRFLARLDEKIAIAKMS